MYLAKLKISNFRKLQDNTFHFINGLNIVLGENNIGKTALIDSLRTLFSGSDGNFVRLTTNDRSILGDGSVNKKDITFQFIFSGLNNEEEAEFLSTLIPIAETEEYEAHININYSQIDETSDRMRVKRWGGELEENQIDSELLDSIRGAYLKPLRDPSTGLKPGKQSQLARLFKILSLAAPEEIKNLEAVIKEYDEKLVETKSVESTQKNILNNHKLMLGGELLQSLELNVNSNSFDKFASRLSIEVDNLEIEKNGLGYNNLIYMAVVLSEMIEDKTTFYNCLIVEEPEAHLHPQLQYVLLEYLQNLSTDTKSAPQIFLTTHSPNFASSANLNSLTCITQTNDVVATFNPRDTQFDTNETENRKLNKKLERYLDVTRGELFFSKKIIFVEGAAEMMLMHILAKDCEFNLRKKAVSVINVEGLNFNCFLPLFHKEALTIPVSVITDSDPKIKKNGVLVPHYPCLNEQVNPSDTCEMLVNKQMDNEYIQIFYGQKTLEYDLALFEENRVVMLKALKELHPKIGDQLHKDVNSALTDQEKAKTLFCGMFERGANKKDVQKGSFAQVLAYILENENHNFIVPDYIKKAFEHVCK